MKVRIETTKDALPRIVFTSETEQERHLVTLTATHIQKGGDWQFSHEWTEAVPVEDKKP